MDNYLKISEVSRLLGISSHNIRYYEKEGLLKLNHKSEKGYRLFSYGDMDYLSTIMILRGSQIPIKNVKELIEDYTPSKYIGALNQSSTNIQNEIDRLVNLKKEIDNIISGYGDSKLGFYKKTEEIRPYVLVKECSLNETLTEREFYKFIKKHSITFENVNLISMIYILSGNTIRFCLLKDFHKDDVESSSVDNGEYLCYKFVSSSEEDISLAVKKLFNYIVENKINIKTEDVILKELYNESFYHTSSFHKTYEIQIQI